MIKTPILFIIFNRPETTQQVFTSIRNAQPTQLYIAADGPRENVSGEKELCKQARHIVSQIDWKCEVKTLFQEKNLGCKIAVSSAIDWFFKNVEEGIILEDDCLPDSSFFLFCEKMLEKYRGDKNIMHISGTNFQFGEKIGPFSYYFSHCPHVWGWATWKRSWVHYSPSMFQLDAFISSNKAAVLFKNKKVAHFWNSLFQHVKKKDVDTWDVQWSYSVMNQAGISITPNINLVKNIGFGNNSTHTQDTNSKLQQNSSTLSEIKFAPEIILDTEADTKLYEKVYFRSLFDRIQSKIRIMIKSKI